MKQQRAKRKVATRQSRSGKHRGTFHVPVVIEQDADGVFIVSVPTLRGCHSYGYTLDEAMTNITEAALLCLEDERPHRAGTFVGVRDLQIAV